MNFFKKTSLLALAAVLALASLPFTSVSAAGQNDPSTPQSQVSNERLEQIWAHQLRVYNRFGRVDQFTDRIQHLIDRGKANGKDVSAVQAALNTFEVAAKEAHPTYESMKSIVNSHQGFDENGKVIDPVKAQETVRAMHEKIQEIKTTMSGTGRALREAIRAFRQANPHLQPATTPASGS